MIEDLNPQQPTHEDNEAARLQMVAALSVTTDGFIDAEIARQGQKVPDPNNVTLSVEEPDNDVGSRFTQSYLQREDHLDGRVMLTRRVNEDGTTDYTVSRPGYEYSVLKYTWTSGGTEVIKGFSEGAYLQKAGLEPGRTRASQHPVSLSVEEMGKFNGMVAELSTTHVPEKRRSRIANKIRHIAGKVALR